MLNRLAELVVVDTQGAVQPLEHVDFGDSELFFSGMPVQGLIMWGWAAPALCGGLLLLLKLALLASHVHFKSRWCHLPCTLARCVKLYQHSNLPGDSIDKHTHSLS